MKSIRLPFTILTSLVLGASTLGLFAEGAAVNSSDKSFLQNAYEDGLAEIHAAELGKGKTANADVKSFSDHIAADHAKANVDLKTLADSKKVTLATSPSLVAQGKAKLLDAKSGESFDKAFAEAMVNDHKKAIDAFEKAAKEGKDPDVKAFAEKILPTLKMHLSMAEDLQTKVGK